MGVTLTRCAWGLALALALGAAVRAQEPPREEREAAPAETPAELIESMARDDFQGSAASRKLAAMGTPALPHLIRATEHEVPRVRYWSIAAMSSIGDERAVPAVLGLLDDPDGLVRAVAVWHSGRWFHRQDVREAVVGALEDASPFVRGWAMRVIQEKDYAEAVEPVRRLLEAPEPEVRHDALHTLALLEGPAALETLEAALREDESALVRECAVRCCSVLDPPSAESAELLIAALRDKDEAVREAAARLLRKGFGRHFGFDAAGDPLEREEAVRRWREWYNANAERLRWCVENRRFEPAKDEAPAAAE
jgi:HEAT repeat protein